METLRNYIIEDRYVSAQVSEIGAETIDEGALGDTMQVIHTIQFVTDHIVEIIGFIVLWKLGLKHILKKIISKVFSKLMKGSGNAIAKFSKWIVSKFKKTRDIDKIKSKMKVDELSDDIKKKILRYYKNPDEYLKLSSDEQEDFVMSLLGAIDDKSKKEILDVSGELAKDYSDTASTNGE